MRWKIIMIKDIEMSSGTRVCTPPPTIFSSALQSPTWLFCSWVGAPFSLSCLWCFWLNAPLCLYVGFQLHNYFLDSSSFFCDDFTLKVRFSLSFSCVVVHFLHHRVLRTLCFKRTPLYALPTHIIYLCSNRNIVLQSKVCTFLHYYYLCLYDDIFRCASISWSNLDQIVSKSVSD